MTVHECCTYFGPVLRGWPTLIDLRMATEFSIDKKREKKKTNKVVNKHNRFRTCHALCWFSKFLFFGTAPELLQIKHFSFSIVNKKKKIIFPFFVKAMCFGFFSSHNDTDCILENNFTNTRMTHTTRGRTAHQCETTNDWLPPSSLPRCREDWFNLSIYIRTR